eukprot:m.4115 g.4115  ORF g.4115 m.4115 type:complete len:614 (+) comp10237_c0_seq1:50-1891(+)
MGLGWRRRHRKVYLVISLIVIAISTTVLYEKYVNSTLKRRNRLNSVRQLLFGEKSLKSDRTPDEKYLADPPNALSPVDESVETQKPLTAKAVSMIVNEKEFITGLKDSDDVYVPFKFVRRYFDVYGREDASNASVFHIDHAYSEPKRPQAPYDPIGPFLGFSGISVESRDRVMYVSGVDGVPVTSQWDKRGHRYPIQISQMCLAHYSQLVTMDNPGEAKKVEDGRGARRWMVRNEEQMYVRSVRSRQVNRTVIEFNTEDSEDDDQFQSASLSVNIKPGRLSTAVFQIRFFSDGALIFHVRLNNREKYTVSYQTEVEENLPVKVDGNEITYLIGPSKEWRKFARNIALDVQKAVIMTTPRRQKEEKEAEMKGVRLVEVISISATGHGQIAFIKFQFSEHRLSITAAANWLVHSQDEKGGWPVAAQRNLAEGMTLEPGWYSAMGQGQAISCLCRQYHLTKQLVYLNAALKATRLFRVSSKDGGVLANFMGVLPWYEEYPTVPSAFVLNGFVYSLFGLYDLSQTAGGKGREAAKLFSDGMKSLEKMLPLYDLGSRTSYDLRHVALQIEPRVARWDYHSVHVTQLLFLGTIDQERTLWNKTAERWEQYMHGYRARHN